MKKQHLIIISSLFIVFLMSISVFSIQFSGTGPIITDGSGSMFLGMTNSNGFLQLVYDGDHTSPHLLLETSTSQLGGRLYVKDDTLYIEQGARGAPAKTRLRLIDGHFIFENEGGELYFNNNGNLGVGIVQPSVKLEVDGTIMANNVRFANPVEGSERWNIHENDNRNLVFKQGDTVNLKLKPEGLVVTAEDLTIGDNKPSNLNVRHINGKAPFSSEVDHLYLQHATEFGVEIGSDVKESSLKVYGNLSVTGNISSGKSGGSSGPILGFHPVNISNKLVFLPGDFESSVEHTWGKKGGSDTYILSVKILNGKVQSKISINSVCGKSDSDWQEGVIESYTGRCMSTEGRTPQCHKGYTCESTTEFGVENGIQGIKLIHPRIFTRDPTPPYSYRPYPLFLPIG